MPMPTDAKGTESDDESKLVMDEDTPAANAENKTEDVASSSSQKNEEEGSTSQQNEGDNSGEASPNKKKKLSNEKEGGATGNGEDLQEKHRLECLDNLEKIEKEFSDLKEKFFRDQMESLKAECEAIKLGSHEKFLEKVRELEEKKNDKVWSAQQWREYQLQNINNVFEAEKRQSEEEYKLEKRQLRDRMIHSIEDKIKKLEDEKNTMNLIEGADNRITRTLRRRGKEPTRDSHQSNLKRKLNPPHINYTLKESEILEDLAQIQRGRESKHARV